MSQMALDVSKIEPMKEVERQVYDPNKLKRLREDIRRHGIHNAIHVIKKPKSKDRYETFIGIHRLKCAKALTEKDRQFSYVPVIIENISREEAIAKGFRDNNLQEPINPMDTARTIKILKGHGLNYEKTAKMLFGSEKHLSLVKQYARLLHLPLPVQNRVKEGRIPWSNAILLVKLMNDDKIVEACEFSITHNLGRNEIKERIRSGDFGEISRKIQGNPTRCFSCGEMTSYKNSRSKQICLDCLKEVGKTTVNPLTVTKSRRRRKSSVNPLTEKDSRLAELKKGFKQAGEELSRRRKFFKELSEENIKAVKKKWKLSDGEVKYVIDYAKDEEVSLEKACEWLKEQDER